MCVGGGRAPAREADFPAGRRSSHGAGRSPAGGRCRAAGPAETRTSERAARTAWLVTRIVSSAAWIGIDVVLAVLVFTALLTDDRMVAATCYQALHLFAVWPLLVTGLVCLVSGVVLGVGSKLVLNVVLTTLGVLALRPTVDDAVDYGRSLLTGVPLPAPTDLIFPPTVPPICLLVAVLLSGYKPWGRVKRQGRAGTGAGRHRRAPASASVTGLGEQTPARGSGRGLGGSGR